MRASQSYSSSLGLQSLRPYFDFFFDAPGNNSLEAWLQSSSSVELDLRSPFSIDALIHRQSDMEKLRRL